jgi:N-sulfoglucosamine sulfohydrolase
MFSALGMLKILARDQPNIIWISCEDMSAHLSCYGDSTISTPNIDRLAREGILYTHAFTTAGVCAPSRNAIITGRYQTSNGAHNMRTLYNTMPEKTGLPTSYSVVMPENVKAFPEYLRAAGYYCTNNEKTDYQFEAPPTVWDESGKAAHWRNRNGDQPFFAVFNNVITHESQVWARKENPLRVDPEKIKVPPYYPDTKTVRQDMAVFYSNIKEMDDWVGQILKQLEEDQLLEKTIIFFWSDHGDGLPFAKREIYDRGIRVPLIVRIPGDANTGRQDNQLISMIDLAPTVLSMAGIPPPASMQGMAFHGKYKSRKKREYIFAARDRMDSETDRVRAIRDRRFKYIRNFFPEKPLYQDIAYRLQQPMMREILKLREDRQLNALQMKWFVTPKPRDELYDTYTDPLEFNNLAEQPAYAIILKKLSNEMDNWLTSTNDLDAIEEKKLVSQMWNGSDKPPQTSSPVAVVKKNILTIGCATPGASLGYKVLMNGEPESPAWTVYTQPVQIKKGGKLKIIAQRIGYTKSDEVVVDTGMTVKNE